jgi:hypothetical protein
MIRTAMGLKSKPPKLGRLRRTGPKMGSVTWFTKVMTVTSTGCGLPPVIGMTKVKITLAKIATVKRVIIALRMPANILPLSQLN